MTSKLGLYSKVNESPFYMPDALTPMDIVGEIKIASGCKRFDKQKITILKSCKSND